ncbi:MAG: 50S ribosomal protein L17 [Alphaproteobacteria bacterium]
MRHNYSGRKLNRKTSHRIALLKNLSKSLILHEQIETTLPKAKDLRPFVEKILTIGKKNNLASRRRVYSYLGDKKIVDKVFDELAKRYQKRSGGYIRILKSGFRYGDSAPKAVIELVERNTNAKGAEDKLRLKDSVSQESDKKESQAQMENKPLETNKPSASAKTDKSSQKKDSETKT